MTTTETPMTAQQVFDLAASGIIAQGKPGAREGTTICTYYDRDTGCRCGVGHVLTLEEAMDYRARDAGSVSEVADGIAVVRCANIQAYGTYEEMPARMRHHGRLLVDIQAAHDGAAGSWVPVKTGGAVAKPNPDFMRDYLIAMAKVAARHELDPAVLRQQATGEPA